MTQPSTQHRLVRRTPLYHWHVAHGAAFYPELDWQIPAVFAPLQDAARAVETEAAQARSGLGIADVSAYAKASLLGSGVQSVVDSLPGQASRLEPGIVVEVQLSGPVLACRLALDHLFMIDARFDPTDLRRRMAGISVEGGVVYHDATCAYAGISLIGPNTLGLLGRVTALDVDRVTHPGGFCAVSGLAGVPAIMVRPPGAMIPWMAVFVAWDRGQYVWERLFDAGARLAAVPIGRESLSKLVSETARGRDAREA